MNNKSIYAIIFAALSHNAMFALDSEPEELSPRCSTMLSPSSQVSDSFIPSELYLVCIESGGDEEEYDLNDICSSGEFCGHANGQGHSYNEDQNILGCGCENGLALYNGDDLDERLLRFCVAMQDDEEAIFDWRH